LAVDDHAILREGLRALIDIEPDMSLVAQASNGHSLELIGHFHSDKWGEFRTYFKFQLSPSGRIRRLDIGLAD
jgi:hypothetical protein